MSEKKDRKTDEQNLSPFFHDGFETVGERAIFTQGVLDRMDPEEARKIWERLPEEIKTRVTI